jgi:hypothetical protein
MQSLNVSFPNRPGATAKISVNEPADFTDVVVELFRGETQVVDIVISIDHKGEFVLRTTDNGMKFSDEHQAVIHPERPLDGARGNFVDGCGVLLLPMHSLTGRYGNVRASA